MADMVFRQESESYGEYDKIADTHSQIKHDIP